MDNHLDQEATDEFRFFQVREITPERFKAVLFHARTAIVNSLDVQYQKSLEISPNAQRGSYPVMRLHKDPAKALSDQGNYARYNQQYYRGTFFDKKDLKPKYHGYWESVEEVNLIPIAKENETHGSLGYMSGLSLELRDTPLEPIPDLDTEGEHLGYIENEDQKLLYDKIIELGQSKNQEVSASLFDKYTEIAHQNISKLTGENYTKAQIGLLIQKAKIYLRSGNFSRCREELDDALVYSENMGYTDIANRLIKIIETEEIRIQDILKKKRLMN
jgi:hypothetical protein